MKVRAAPLLALLLGAGEAHDAGPVRRETFRDPAVVASHDGVLLPPRGVRCKSREGGLSRRCTTGAISRRHYACSRATWSGCGSSMLRVLVDSTRHHGGVGLLLPGIRKA